MSEIKNFRVGKMYVCGKDCCRICADHDFESNCITYINTFLKPGMVFLDIGAHTGLYSVNAADKVGEEGIIIAFEVEESSWTALNKNCQMYPQIQSHRKAVWDKKETCKLALTGHPGGNFIIMDTAQTNDFPIVEIDAISLDEFLPDDFKVNVVKLDIEGAEFMALKGMEKILQRSDHVLMLVEYASHHMTKFGYTPQELTEWLEAQGFVYWGGHGGQSAPPIVSGSIYNFFFEKKE